MKSILFGLSFLLLSNICFALEIKNARVSTAGSTITLNYDLYGKPGERSANVKVAVVIDGERYKPGAINIIGDYGTSTSVGKGKKISWNLLKDMPAGYSGSLIFEIDAEPELANDPFNIMGTKNKVKAPIVSDYTIADPSSKFVWIRSPLSIKPVNSLDAAVAVVGKMNEKKYLGFNDWRLPKKAEYESLLKMIQPYGYQLGQSALPYLSKVGFDIPRNSKFWTIDRSSVETIGRSVSVSGSGRYGGNVTSNRSTTYNSGSSNYTRNAAVSGGGSVDYYAKSTAIQETVNAGLDSLFIDTKDGYFYKHNGYEEAYVFAVRGDCSSDLYAVSVQADVAITP